MNDFISLHEAIKKIDERGCEMFTLDSSYFVYLRALRDVAADLRNMPTIDAVPDWIPVTERLPKIGKDVLCFCRANIYMVLGWDGNHWHEGADRYYMSGFVTHWMPLPKPPKEEDDV